MKNSRFKLTIRLFAVAFAAMLMLTGCGGNGLIKNDSVVKAQDGYAEGRIGTTFETAFFNYSVDDVKYISEYEGLKPAEGMQLIDATITVTNTFGDEMPLFYDDFQVQWHDLGQEEEFFGYGTLIPGSTTLIPEEMVLKRAETFTGHVVYEVPAEAKEFSISFLELFEDGAEGDVFFTWFEK